MDRPNRKRLLKIGGVLIIVSVVLFTLSVYLINTNTVSAQNVTILPGTTYTLSKGHISAGDDIDYSITTTLNPFNVTSYLKYDTGSTAAYVNATNSSSVTNVIVSHSAGNVSLVIVNTGQQSISVDVSVGSVDYFTLLTLVFGFVLLPSGIVLVGIYSYARYVERKKEKLFEGYRKN